jgi:hypothetical protein
MVMYVNLLVPEPKYAAISTENSLNFSEFTFESIFLNLDCLATKLFHL